MNTFVNPQGFQAAISYTNRHFFSTPYSITRNCDRWFSQLAIVQLENGALLNLHGKTAQRYIDIYVDNKKIAKDEIANVLKYFSPKENNPDKLAVEPYKTKTVEEIEQVIAGLDKSKDKQLHKALTELKQAKPLYQAIVERGESRLNYKTIEKAENSEVKKVMYRPNHGLLHSVRAASYVTRINEFNNKYQRYPSGYNNNQLQRLQLMMLFSVVGRKDETGFDAGNTRDIYQGFRATSGREFLKYCKQHATELYRSDEEMLRDAAVVELMGYQASQLKDLAEHPLGKGRSVKIPDVLIDAVVARDNCDRNQAETKLQQQGLSELFSGENLEPAMSFLTTMNQCHGLDLSRCYPLRKTEERGPQFIGVPEGYLRSSGFTQKPTLEKLEDVYNLLHDSFTLMKTTGQRTRIGLISRDEFDANKQALLDQVKGISEPEAILNKVIGELINDNLLRYQPSAFDFNITNEEASVDNEQIAKEVIERFKYLQRPEITNAIKHDDKVYLTFDSDKQLEVFRQIYKDLFSKEYELISTDSKEKTIAIEKEEYNSLKSQQFLHFKPVSVPKKISSEQQLVDTEVGLTEAQKLIQFSQGLTRVFSTSKLSDSALPDHQYFFNSLQDPTNERFVSPYLNKMPNTLYTNPLTGEQFQRQLTGRTPVYLQEPITKEQTFEQKLQEGLQARNASDRGSAKNTIFTKKLAHSLLPSDGKMEPFSGYGWIRHKFFPIGVLSDINEVNLKGGRYVWSENMATGKRYWLQDNAKVNQQLIKLTNFKQLRDDYKEPIDSIVEKIQLVQQQLDEILQKKYFQPEGVLEEMRQNVINKIRDYKKVFRDSPENGKITEAFTKVLVSIEKEIKRASPKYSISIRDLKKQTQAGGEEQRHNEVLAGNTKQATRAIFANKDELFYRLNLLTHAMSIKEQYGIDVPLLILSEHHSPKIYTEEMIKNDIQEAFSRIKNDDFPYDRTMVGVYDDQGKKVFDSSGNRKMRPKDLSYQKTTLVQLFKTAFPDLKRLTQLNKKSIGNIKINENSSQFAADKISEKLELVGSPTRERNRMAEIFPNGETSDKEEFLLRQVVLGNLNLVKELFKEIKVVPTDSLLRKSIKFAKKNNHADIENLLVTIKTKIKNQTSLVNNKINSSNILSEKADKKPDYRKFIEALAEYQKLEKIISNGSLEQRISKCFSKLNIQSNFNSKDFNRDLFIGSIDTNNMELFDALIEKHPTLLRTVDNQGRTALYHAVLNGNSQVIDKLLQAGYEISEQDDKKELHNLAKDSKSSKLFSAIKNVFSLDDKKTKYFKEVGDGNNGYLDRAKSIIARYLDPTGCSFFSRKKNFKQSVFANDFLSKIHSIDSPQILLNKIDEELDRMQQKLDGKKGKSFMLDRYCRHLYSAKTFILENMEKEIEHQQSLDDTSELATNTLLKTL